MRLAGFHEERCRAAGPHQRPECSYCETAAALREAASRAPTHAELMAQLRMLANHEAAEAVAANRTPPADRPTRTKLYIAGPMTGLPEFNYPAFHAAKAELVAAGYLVLSPADNDDGQPHDWAWFMRKALAQLIRCDGVAVLPGSACSRGAHLEITVARALGMEVRPVSAWLTNNPTPEPGAPQQDGPTSQPSAPAEDEC